MSTRIEPVRLYSRRHFVFLELGIAASGALDSVCPLPGQRAAGHVAILIVG